MEKEMDINQVIKNIVSSPIIRIDRDSFLKTALSHHFDEDTVRKAIENTPAYAGITVEEINKIADASINFETTKVSAISFAAGIPGGLAMIGTIPADIAQYFAHIFIITQKLLYLYGWPDLLDDSGQMDDDSAAMLIHFLGVMSGSKVSEKYINQLSNIFAKKLEEEVAKELEKEAARKAAEEAAKNAAAKQAAATLAAKNVVGNATRQATQKVVNNQILNNAFKNSFRITSNKAIEKYALSSSTKIIVKSEAAKAIPLIGAFFSGAITYASFNIMSKRFKNHLANFKQAKPEFYTKIKN